MHRWVIVVTLHHDVTWSVNSTKGNSRVTWEIENLQKIVILF